MSFDEKRSDVSFLPPPPDYSEGLNDYYAQVKEISEKIKSGQSELDNLNSQIDLAKKNLQNRYDKQVSDLGNQIEVLTAQLADLQIKHDNWVVKVKDRQTKHDAIVLDLSNNKKVLDDNWAEFNRSVHIYQLAQEKLVADQNQLAELQKQLDEQLKSFQEYREKEQTRLDQYSSEIETLRVQLNDKAESNVAQAKNNQIELSLIENKNNELSDRIAIAQEILKDAELVENQKRKNELDAKNNSNQAIQNQADANQIRVSMVVLHNKEQELNSRMVTLQAAEAALKTGG